MESKFSLVVGLGKTGQSIARHLSKRNINFAIFDTRKKIACMDVLSQEFNKTPIFLQDLPESIFKQLNKIIVSPGVSLQDPVLQKALKQKIPIYGDLECLAKEITAPVVAITGTNGKSTVTTLVGEMAKLAGIRVAIAGNIGTPVLDLLNDGKQYDLWVLELSSFQLDLTYSLKPIASTILNISPDHLDRYENFAAYSKSKHRIYNNSKNLLYNRNDSATLPNISAENIGSFGLDPPDDNNWGIIKEHGINYLAQGKKKLLSVEELKIQGKQNWQNALAAAALATIIKISSEVQVTVLKNFSGLPHRCQLVKTLSQVSWINDSKGTNIGATISAIEGIGATCKGKIILIAGGIGKGADFTELRPAIMEYVRALVLIGEDAIKIDNALNNFVPITHSNTLEAAVNEAKLQAKPFDTVLLSPACASFDQFRDFNHRGDVFMHLVNNL